MSKNHSAVSRRGLRTGRKQTARLVGLSVLGLYGVLLAAAVLCWLVSL